MLFCTPSLALLCLSSPRGLPSRSIQWVRLTHASAHGLPVPRPSDGRCHTFACTNSTARGPALLITGQGGAP
jgi:hypothetical protein